MQHFKLVISNDASLSGKIISYCCITQINWLQKWTVIVACHHLFIKLRHICDIAETSLVARDNNSNHNSTPTFLFSIWGHPRIPLVSKNMNASCRRKSNNGKRTRKWTWPIHNSGAQRQNIVHSWTLATGNIHLALLLDSFHRHLLIMCRISNVAS